MARPIKKGIDYFNLDVDFLRDIKVRKIMRACGNQSIAVLICLLCNIYQDEGYYMTWDADMRFLVADDIGAKESAVQDVVLKASEVGFFDAVMFKQENILTSKRIQENYKLASRQKKDSSILKKYRLPRVSNTDNGVSNVGNEVNNTDNPHSISEQSKSNNNKTNKTDPRDLRRQEFLTDVWAIYPRQEKFGDAWDAYYRATVTGATPAGKATKDQIIQGIGNYKRYLEVKGIQGQYVQQLANWLDNGGWLSNYDMTPPVQPAATSGGQASREAQTYVRNDF
ncbi:DUF4373 domain-containing protein [Lactiplantibacillus plantarum]|uniref:DUF4373 domain-containing protein n=1 Tax=Lactiplantibacillus plantarum TaxID=1590 RepID=UPI0009B4606A|nr:DUF4373 domain-containing protein [Lactiplantibacillus plantarum]CAB1721822.1 hypothetical protein LAP9491_02760 [Lactiplantibacillus plantarum]